MSGRSIETKVVHGFKGYDEITGAVSFPIYQSATFRHPALYETTGYDYSRLQNPTREEVENTLASLEDARFGFAFSSGMAAVTTLVKLFKQNDHVIISDDLYGGVYRLFEEIYAPFGITVTYVDMTDIKEIEAAFRENTKALFIETPTNPMMKIADIAAIAALAKKKDCITIVDNTFLTPYFQQPLKLGADIAFYSGTKYLAGHNDTLAGFIVTDNETIAERMRLVQKSEGAMLSPFDSWLVLRGIKTLSVRLEKHQENALKVAEFLKTCPNVTKVYYPGLKEHKNYSLQNTQATGFGGIISFEVEDAELVEKILRSVKLVIFAESLGGTESLITYPMVQTHNAIPAYIREKTGVNERLLRLSVGIENAEDIIADLKQALEHK